MSQVELNRRPTAALMVVVVALAVALPSTARKSPTFELTVIPPLSTPVGELPVFIARDINDKGQVVGTAQDGSGRFSAAARYSPGRGIEDLDPTGEYRSSGWFINRQGTMLGFIIGGSLFFEDSFLHSDRGSFDFLEQGKTDTVREGFFPGFSVRQGLSKSGAVFGTVFTFEPVVSAKPYVHTAAEGWVDLSGLHPRFADETTFGVYINDAGHQVFNISRSEEDGLREEYFVRSPKGETHEVISPARPTAPGSRPTRKGRMAGLYITDEGKEHAYVWTPRGGLVDIHPDGYQESVAHAMNKKGAAFGVLKKKRKVHEDVFVHTEGEGLEIVASRDELVELARGRRGKFDGVDALDMNNRGEIVGCVSMRGGRDFSFYYSPKHGLFALNTVLEELASDYVELDCSAVFINNKSRILLSGVSDGTRDAGAILRVAK